MRFAFDEEQKLLQKSLGDLLSKQCTPGHVREAWQGDGRVPGLWQALAELGVLGVAVPEAHGGLGLSELDWVLALEEAGRAALPEPLAETMVAAPLLTGEVAEAWLPKLAAGEATISVGLAGWPFVAYAEHADLLVLEQGGGLFAARPGELELAPERSVDGSRRLFRVGGSIGTVGTRLDVGEQALRAAHDRAALARAAELIGLAQRLHAMAVEHAQTRQQFGRPIGAFQAVKHHLVNAMLGLEFARPLVYRAAYSLARGDAEASLHASMAKSAAADAAKQVARIALQVHGAMGYSFEYDLHLYLKRVWALAESWGSASWHRERCAQALLGPAPPTEGDP